MQRRVYIIRLQCDIFHGSRRTNYTSASATAHIYAHNARHIPREKQRLFATATARRTVDADNKILIARRKV